ncbi:uncharacterized protein [Clytia hemisphaerica]|uniref:uncharacterized protein n=1 Tax=Clytia hemisphaerica TaxID=252671 RepID=UPI0034D6AF87
MMDYEPSFTFRSNKASNLRITLRRAQVTPARLATIFKLNAVGLFITEDWEDAQSPQSEFPEDGKFPILENALCGANFIVRGDPSDSANPGQNAEGTGSHTPNKAEETPGPSCLLARFKKTSSTTLQNKLSRKRPNASNLTYSLKVTLAKKRGDDFEFLKEKYITIGEDNCNVDSITRKARVEFGNQLLVLFSSSGKEILDSEGTRELYFWKKPARKVFAATEEQKEESSSPPSIPPKIDNIESNVQAILDLMKKKEENNTALFKALKEALECRVCRDPIVTSPLLYSNCCKQLITCKECIEGLGATPSCPNCRSPDLSTFPNHTFDAILPIMAALIANES